jgi:hypothetical protein
LNITDELQVTVVVYPVYIQLVDVRCVSRWKEFLVPVVVIVLVLHGVHFSLALWDRVQQGSEYIWATSASLHAALFFAALFIAGVGFFDRSEQNREFICSLLCWAILNLAAAVVPMVGAVCGWKTVPLIQCLFSTAVVVGKPVIPVMRKLWYVHGRQLGSRSTTDHRERSAAGDAC